MTTGNVCLPAVVFNKSTTGSQRAFHLPQFVYPDVLCINTSHLSFKGGVITTKAKYDNCMWILTRDIKKHSKKITALSPYENITTN